MSLQNAVSHIGHIESIEGDTILVLITSVSACANCASKKGCMISEKADKKISVQLADTSFFSVGEEVNVALLQSMGLAAVWWAYLLPFLLLLSTLFIGNGLFKNDAFISLISFLCLAIYYAILYLFRNALSKKFTFTISKLHTLDRKE